MKKLDHATSLLVTEYGLEAVLSSLLTRRDNPADTNKTVSVRSRMRITFDGSMKQFDGERLVLSIKREVALRCIDQFMLSNRIVTSGFGTKEYLVLRYLVAEGYMKKLKPKHYAWA